MEIGVIHSGRHPQSDQEVTLFRKSTWELSPKKKDRKTEPYQHMGHTHSMFRTRFISTVHPNSTVCVINTHLPAATEEMQPILHKQLTDFVSKSRKKREVVVSAGDINMTSTLSAELLSRRNEHSLFVPQGGIRTHISFPSLIARDIDHFIVTNPKATDTEVHYHREGRRFEFAPSLQSFVDLLNPP
ncbi:MAG: hypothetical protein KDD70_14335 [Bdellovibrionales bacterium]|nr:hypothetical protein [Bdellovibrionales bacterium]